jgi:hypothetical protein
MKAVWLRMHSPQRWQLNRGILTAFSKKSIMPESRFSPGENDRPFVEMVLGALSVIKNCP